jgi:CRISPR-associated endonuclease/helicase Cas3
MMSAGPRLIEIPTGLGKTAAVVLAWLWNRVAEPDTDARKAWPRRLVYCMPMRTLVEQTEKNVRNWLDNLKIQNLISGDLRVEILMGGEEKTDWDLYPERETILIGTQDMLLSRALNRGYGMSRYRWPMHFALLHNDALWVMDETQLMGVAVETSAQLDAFRQKLRTNGNAPTWWMSATLDRAQLATVDHIEPADGWPVIALSEEDRAQPQVRARVTARKHLTAVPLSLDPATKSEYAKSLAMFIRDRHVPDELTLVVLNRVARAQAVYEQLRKLKPESRLALIHSRFRRGDRRAHEEVLFGEGDRIVVATQAVEAGVDVSARVLITELAPWPSLVQRFGRCNRAGEFTGGADVFWIALRDDKGELAQPYTIEELAAAHAILTSGLADVGPQTLAGVSFKSPPIVRPVLRRKDLLDLFDTTPDLAGNDLDISRYVRDSDDTDVQVFWREVSDRRPPEDDLAPSREELCRVSIGSFNNFLRAKTAPRVFRWDPLEERWRELETRRERARPGATYLIAPASGGYSKEKGWTEDGKDKPGALSPSNEQLEANDRNPLTFIGRWLSLREHTEDVQRELHELIDSLKIAEDIATPLDLAAGWHDVGKAHPVFQQMLTRTAAAPAEEIWAKSAEGGARPPRDRRGFRHEMASALAWLVAVPVNTPERDLVAYLIAAHHGKVRLSIRALPNEEPPEEQPDLLVARGIRDGDELLAVSLDGVPTEPLRIDLSFMQLGDGPHGRPSWLARMLALRDRLGPFRLAFYETLLRAADMRASAKEAAAQS